MNVNDRMTILLNFFVKPAHRHKNYFRRNMVYDNKNEPSFYDSGGKLNQRIMQLIASNELPRRILNPTQLNHDTQIPRRCLSIATRIALLEDKFNLFDLGLTLTRVHIHRLWIIVPAIGSTKIAEIQKRLSLLANYLIDMAVRQVTEEKKTTKGLSLRH